MLITLTISASAWRNQWHSQRLSLCQRPEKSQCYILILLPSTAPNQLGLCLYFRNVWNLERKAKEEECNHDLSCLQRRGKTNTLKSPLAYLPTWKKNEKLKISWSNSRNTSIVSLVYSRLLQTSLKMNWICIRENEGHRWKLTELSHPHQAPAWSNVQWNKAILVYYQSKSHGVFFWGSNQFVILFLAMKPSVRGPWCNLFAAEVSTIPLKVMMLSLSHQGFLWAQRGRTSREIPCGHANQWKGRAKPLNLSQRYNQGAPTGAYLHGLLPMDPIKSITLQEISHEIISFHLYFILGQQTEASGFPGGWTATAGKVSMEATEPALLTVARLFENSKYVNN